MGTKITMPEILMSASTVEEYFIDISEDIISSIFRVGE
jgi:hypothetical protein